MHNIVISFVYVYVLEVIMIYYLDALSNKQKTICCCFQRKIIKLHFLSQRYKKQKIEKQLQICFYSWKQVFKLFWVKLMSKSFIFRSDSANFIWKTVLLKSTELKIAFLTEVPLSSIVWTLLSRHNIPKHKLFVKDTWKFFVSQFKIFKNPRKI